MNYLFSEKKNLFFPFVLKEDYISSGTWPDEGVEVTEQVFAEFSGMPPKGKVRAGVKGLPTWVNAAELTQEAKKNAAESEKSKMYLIASGKIEPLQYALDLNIATEEEIASLNEWKKYIVLLSRVNVNAPVWPVIPYQE